MLLPRVERRENKGAYILRPKKGNRAFDTHTLKCPFLFPSGEVYLMRRADIALPPSKISRTFNLFALALRRPTDARLVLRRRRRTACFLRNAVTRYLLSSLCVRRSLQVPYRCTSQVNVVSKKKRRKKTSITRPFLVQLPPHFDFDCAS